MQRYMNHVSKMSVAVADCMVPGFANFPMFKHNSSITHLRNQTFDGETKPYGNLVKPQRGIWKKGVMSLPSLAIQVLRLPSPILGPVMRTSMTQRET